MEQVNKVKLHSAERWQRSAFLANLVCSLLRQVQMCMGAGALSRCQGGRVESENQ
jgi:hypothetical protein